MNPRQWRFSPVDRHCRSRARAMSATAACEQLETPAPTGGRLGASASERPAGFRLIRPITAANRAPNPLGRKAAAARCECVLGRPERFRLASCVAKWIQRCPREPSTFAGHLANRPTDRRQAGASICAGAPFAADKAPLFVIVFDPAGLGKHLCPSAPPVLMDGSPRLISVFAFGLRVLIDRRHLLLFAQVKQTLFMGSFGAARSGPAGTHRKPNS